MTSLSEVKLPDLTQQDSFYMGWNCRDYLQTDEGKSLKEYVEEQIGQELSEDQLTRTLAAAQYDQKTGTFESERLLTAEQYAEATAPSLIDKALDTLTGMFNDAASKDPTSLILENDGLTGQAAEAIQNRQAQINNITKLI